MEDFLNNDVIAAVSTPAGRGGIGIVRMTGKGVSAIADRIIFPVSGGLLSAVSPRNFIVASVKDSAGGEAVDNVMSVRMMAPLSYTGEDTVEIHCHGSPYILNRVLSLCISEGARLAQPGEFTRRAFLNGRIDLTQAEAVADLIEAGSRISSQCALRQLNGELGLKLDALKEHIVDALSILEAMIDFPEDTEDEIEKENISKKIKGIASRIESLIKSAALGTILKDGYHCVIAGKTNVGKSSLFNCILGYSRSIITDSPGTTRDFISEEIELKGYPVKMTDTAGIMEGRNEVEEESIRRSVKCFENADLIIFVVDASSSLTGEDRETYNKISAKKNDFPVIVVLNKIDLGRKVDFLKVKKEFKSENYIEVSARDGSGIENLIAKIAFYIENEFSGTDRDVAVNLRHRNKLEEINNSLKRVLNGINEAISEEFLASDLKTALDCLGEIKGEKYSDEVLDAIFTRFCIGK